MSVRSFVDVPLVVVVGAVEAPVPVAEALVEAPAPAPVDWPAVTSGFTVSTVSALVLSAPRDFGAHAPSSAKAAIIVCRIT